MSFNKELNLKEIIHPNGGFYRNPSHLAEAEKAYDQSDIVKQIKGMGKKTIRERFTYEDLSSIKAFPGMTKINEMTEEDLQKLMKTILKFRPNITRIRIGFGDYPGTKEIFDQKVSNVKSTHPRNGDEASKDFARLFADKRLNVIDLVYYISSAVEGAFQAEAHAFTSPEYANPEFFSPVVEIEYQKTV